MKFLVLLLVAVICDARPRDPEPAHPSFFELGAGSFIVGGSAASPGQYPYQLSQERLGAQWSHSCGSSLLTAVKSLTAAHCVDGANPGILRVLAGLHDRSQPAGAVVSNCARYVMHQDYNNGVYTFNNDIGIIHFVTSINDNGNNIRFADIQSDNSDHRGGETCQISGWGRTSASNVLPNVLQHVSIQVITEAECNTRMAPVSGARVGPPQICLFGANVGSCNGDSGGPLTCAHKGHGGQQVCGVTSWGIQSGGACLQTYPSVYTRVSFFHAWIQAN